MPPTAAEVERRLARFVERCRKLGIRLTHQRWTVFRELARTEEHPSADAIFARLRPQLPTISLDTVYRTLNLLERKELISKVGTIGSSGRFDANADLHHHFVCGECGRIRDVYCRRFDGLEAPEEVASLGEVKYIRVELRGVCAACGGKRRKKS